MQHLLHNEAKWNTQINEDIGVIKIKSCGSESNLASNQFPMCSPKGGTLREVQRVT